MLPTKTQAQAPARSRDQRMEALKRANDIRVRRAKLKKDLKDGRVRIQTILNNPPEYVSTAKVFDILMAVPKFGRVVEDRLDPHAPVLEVLLQLCPTHPDVVRPFERLHPLVTGPGGGLGLRLRR